MTTARVKYRDYVPDDWFAIEFCDVEFFGNNADILSQKWHSIEYEKCREFRPKADDLENQMDILEKERNSIEIELRNSRHWWKFWSGKYEKELKGRLSRTNQTIKEIKSEFKQVENNMFYDVSTLVRKAEKFLAENGFILKSTNSSGNECVTHTDIWELI